MNDDESLDRLYENLILDPVYVLATMPPEYTRGYLWPGNWGRASSAQDTAYYDSDRKLHRTYGPAYISKHYKYEIWYQHGDVHRVDGPAVIMKNCEFWFQNDKPHRIGGPAISGAGRKKEYWINGQKLSPKIYKLEIERRKKKGLNKVKYPQQILETNTK
jgi:hypothetical protein